MSYHEERDQHLQLFPRFAEAGYEAMWGGGMKNKGHGYWLSRDGMSVANDGVKSGNPWFWMYDDAVALLDGKKQAATISEVFDGGRSWGFEGAAEICEQEVEHILKRGKLSEDERAFLRCLMKTVASELRHRKGQA